MLLALLAIIVCLCLPIGKFEAADGLASNVVWYNLGIYSPDGFMAKPIPFVDLCVAGTLSFITIFLFNKRKSQIKLCAITMLLCILWYAYYAFSMFVGFEIYDKVSISFAACLPFVAIILLFLAIKGIKADENLIKSMDRIR